MGVDNNCDIYYSTAICGTAAVHGAIAVSVVVLSRLDGCLTTERQGLLLITSKQHPIRRFRARTHTQHVY